MAKKPPSPMCMLRGHEGAVTALCFSDEENTGLPVAPSLISGSDIGEIFMWNLKTQRSYHQFKAHNGKMILYLFYYKSSLISQGRDGLINIWKFNKNHWDITVTFNCPNYGFCAATLFLTEENAFLVAPTGEGSALTFYDYETADVLFNYAYRVDTTQTNLTDNGRETCMCLKVFSKETNIFLLMGYDSGNISLWDYKSKKEKSRLKCHSDVVLCLDFDSKYKNKGISGSIDDRLQVWEITDDDQLLAVRTVTVTNPGVSAIKIRDDGKIVISAGQDCAVRVFSWKNLRLLAVLQYHTMPVVALQFYNGLVSNFESVFVSGSKDKNILLWSIYKNQM